MSQNERGSASFAFAQEVCCQQEGCACSLLMSSRSSGMTASVNRINH